MGYTIIKTFFVAALSVLSINTASFDNESAKFFGTKAQVRLLAAETNTLPQCFLHERTPVPITDLTPVMGTWYETVKSFDGSTIRHVCEKTTYDLLNNNTSQFSKHAVYNMRPSNTSFTMDGVGYLIQPGIVDIRWRNLETGEPNSLVYMILGLNISSYMVGYTCENGAKKPEIVINSRTEDPSQETINEAMNVIRCKGLPIEWLGCVV